MKEIPIYLFLGFLEGGKTKFIQETMQDPRFDSGENTLILCCEEGIEEYAPERFQVKKFTLQYIDEDDLNEQTLKEINKKTRPDRILLEYNGMWQVEALFNALPPNWFVNQVMLFIDSNTILNYNANMRQLVFDKLSIAELIVFNRYSDKIDMNELHKMVRAVSRRPQIIYEYLDGRAIPDDIQDPLPFDINAEIIEIADKDYALWYRDICEDPKKYINKKVKFKGIIAKDKKLPPKTMVIGRHIMTCCEADISYSGLLLKTEKSDMFSTKDWAIVTAQITFEYSPVYDGKGPILNMIDIEKSDKPEQEVATFF